MITLTPAGRQAYEIAQWAFGDPASRARQALGRLAEMTPVDEQERNEIGDAATMVSRLASSLEPQARTITDQTVSTISGQMDDRNQ